MKTNNGCRDRCVYSLCYKAHKHRAQSTGHSGQSLLDMLLFLLLAVLSHQLSPARSERRQGFQSVKLPWVEDYPSRLSVVSVTHFSTQTWKLYHLSYPFPSVQCYHQCFPSERLMRGPKVRLLLCI